MSLSRFADVRAVMDQAVNNYGLRWELSSHSAAIRSRHRCYQFRKAAQKLRREQFGVEATTPYDQLLIQLEGDTKEERDRSSVLIFSFHKPVGKMFAPDGTEISPEVSPDPIPEESSDLFLEIQAEVERSKKEHGE